MDTFSYAIRHIFEAEGGYVNHPNDKGGATNFGITKATLAKYRKEPVLSPDDVQNMSKEEAMQIYFNLYWVPFGLFQINSHKVAIALFDQVVNRNGKLVIKSVQDLLNQHYAQRLNPDGVLGPLTARAINQAEPYGFILKFSVLCQKFYLSLAKKNPTQMVFLEGWLARTWRWMS